MTTSPRVRLVPGEVQLRLDEPSDAELLALLRATRDAPTQETWRVADDALTALYRTLEWQWDTYLRVLDRVRELRKQVRAERPAVA